MQITCIYKLKDWVENPKHVSQIYSLLLGLFKVKEL